MTEEEQRRVDYIKRRIWNQKDNQRIKVDGPHKDCSKKENVGERRSFKEWLSR